MELRRAGCTSREMSRSVREGVVVRLRRGLYALPGADRALVRAIGLGGVVTCVSALSHHGVALINSPDRPHIAVEKGFTSAGRDVAGVNLHYVPRGSLAAVRGWHDAATGLDIAGRCLSESAHLIAIDNALHAGLLRPDQIAGFTRSTNARRDWLLGHADARAESPPETVARLSIAQARLAVQPQRFISGVGRVDFVVEGRVVVEVDGRQHHDDPRAFQRDRGRDRELVRQGFLVLRYTFADICGQGAKDVGAEVAAALLAVPPLRTPSD